MGTNPLITETDEHGNCPSCGTDFNGGSIWLTGYEKALNGEHYGQEGTRASKEEAETLADRYAKAYGATRTTGQWGRQIGIYSIEKDRTVAWRCPECGHEWVRK